MMKKWLALVICLLMAVSMTGHAASQQPHLLKSVLSIGVGETSMCWEIIRVGRGASPTVRFI